MKPLLTIAATSDIHSDKNTIKKNFFNLVNGRADVLLVAGDMNNGEEAQARHFLSLISGVKVPIIIVFGSHDADSKNLGMIRKILEKNSNVTILEGEYAEFRIKSLRAGFAGTKGFPGGFAPNELRGKIGERIIKVFRKEGDKEVLRLKKALEKMSNASPDVKIVLTHVAPFKEAVVGEPVEIYPFLGNSRLGDAIREEGVNLAICGHAHFGSIGLIKIDRKTYVCNVGYSLNSGKMVWIDFFPNKKFRIRRSFKL